MKTTRLLRWALFAALMAVFGLLGCEKLDIYSIDSPSDLQNRIDSIAAANAAANSGDTTFLTIATTIVGAEDNTAAWWTAFSDYFAIPSGKLLHLEFVNHSSGVNNYNNWNLVVANVEGHSTTDNADYSEYFVLRSDAFGWGNSDYDGNMITNDYPDTDGDGDVWNDFRTTMQGAYVSIDVDHSATGNVYVTATAVGTNGTTITETYQQPVSATEDIVAFLVCDGSYFEMKKAYLIPSKVTEVVDVDPDSIVITGTPTFVEIGNTNFWGDAKATVYFADGSSTEVDSSNLSFTVVPDMSTVGTKAVVVTYNKTKQGAYSKPISSSYTLLVANAITALEITTMPTVTTYTFPGPTAPWFDPTGMVVTATYSDGTKSVIANENLQFVNPGGEGAQNAVVTYVGATSTVTTTCPITNSVGATETVGPTDFASVWWTSFSNEYNVASGSSRVFTMRCYSSGANNWNAPLVILRKANKTEYAVLRMDNFGWGSSWDATKATSDWDWTTFASNINDSDIKITITNSGDNTVTVRYDVTYANGTTHYQEYTGLTIDSSDLNCAITIDGCYVNITKVE